MKLKNGRTRAIPVAASGTDDPRPGAGSTLSRRALIGSWLGWTFDGFETTTVILVAPAAVAALGNQGQLADPSKYTTGLIAGTLIGWALGGILAGAITDRIGRRRALMLSVAAYALFSGLSALANEYWMLFALLFVTGAGLGAEWGAGTALVSETSQARKRGWAGGLLQSGFGFGSLAASFAWLLLRDSGGGAWRYMFLFGALPALFVLYIRRSTPESPMWEGTQGEGATGRDGGHGNQVNLFARFKIGFSTPELRKRGLLLFLGTITTVVGFYAVSSWFYQYVAILAADAGLNGPSWGSNASIVFNASAIVGYLLLGYLADRLGRKLLIFSFFAGSLVVVLLMFHFVHAPGVALVLTGFGGFFILGQFSWMPIYMPELFPTAARATAMGLIFNSSRIIGAALTFTSGILVSSFGGIETAASTIGLVYILGMLVILLMPETKGNPLPR